MRVRNVTKKEMELALKKINKKYKNNVIWNRFEGERVFNFTLKVKNSREKGAKLGHYVTKSGELRKTCSACWHVHGDFFDALLKINPEAIIVSCHSTIDKYGGNWIDTNIGSLFNPQYYSEACECE